MLVASLLVVVDAGETKVLPRGNTNGCPIPATGGDGITLPLCLLLFITMSGVLTVAVAMEFRLRRQLLPGIGELMYCGVTAAGSADDADVARLNAGGWFIGSDCGNDVSMGGTVCLGMDHRRVMLTPVVVAVSVEEIARCLLAFVCTFRPAFSAADAGTIAISISVSPSVSLSPDRTTTASRCTRARPFTIDPLALWSTNTHTPWPAVRSSVPWAASTCQKDQRARQLTIEMAESARKPTCGSRLQ